MFQRTCSLDLCDHIEVAGRWLLLWEVLLSWLAASLPELPPRAHLPCQANASVLWRDWTHEEVWYPGHFLQTSAALNSAPLTASAATT